jgi:hypothetical protein
MWVGGGEEGEVGEDISKRGGGWTGGGGEWRGGRWGGEEGEWVKSGEGGVW